jgi:tetratricopeptide (TPR) repeat protein
MSKGLKYINIIKRHPFKYAFAGLILLALMVNISIYKDFSITNDEPIHHVHGQVILDYYLGNDSTAVLSPIDSSGNLIKTFTALRDAKIRGMNFFGGFPDLIVAAVAKIFPTTDQYHIRHLVTSFWGLLALIFAGLLARLISNWRAAFMAALILWLSPRFFGHSFYNPKDLPFAAIYIIALFLILKTIKSLPRFNWKAIAFLILSIGVSVAIRVSGMLLIAYLAMAMFAWWLLQKQVKPWGRLHIIRGIYLFVLTLLIAFAAYFSTTLFWPYASVNVWAPLLILPRLTNFELFNSFELYFGRWYNSNENPWHYGVVWTFASLPLTYLLAVFLYPVLFLKKNVKGEPFILIAIGLLLFAAIFPLIYVILKNSVIYNEARHLLFIVPVFAVLTALSFERLFSMLQRTSYYFLSIAVFVAFTTEPALWILKNHPLQGMYFSPIIGGTQGAFKRLEFDYWGVSTKPALEWIANNTGATEQAPVRVKMFFGESIKARHFIVKYYPNLIFIPGNQLDNWDYEIKFTVEAKFDSTLIFNWPPEGTIHEIKAGGAPIAAIIKNPWLGKINNLEERINSASNANEMITIGLEAYSIGDYHRCIKATKKALVFDPENAIAWNNLCSAYNRLRMFELAVNAGKEALRIQPDFPLAKANLQQSITGMMVFESEPRTAGDYLSMSYYLFLQQDYTNGILMCFEALRLEPKNANAFNNLCSFYNLMGEYEKAKEACEQALQIDPDFILAKNNLGESLKGLENLKSSAKNESR